MPSSEELGRQLIEVVSLAREPVPAEVAADVLEISVEEILRIGEELAAREMLLDTTDGFSFFVSEAAAEAVSSLGEARRARVLARLAGALERNGWGDRSPGLVGTYYAEAHQWDEALRFLDDQAGEGWPEEVHR